MGSNLARLSPIRQKYSPWRLARTSSIGATLAAVVASPIFGQPADVNVARAAAILECNKLASPYLIYTWAIGRSTSIAGAWPSTDKSSDELSRPRRHWPMISRAATRQRDMQSMSLDC